MQRLLGVPDGMALEPPRLARSLGALPRTVLRARELDDRVILGHVRGALNAPTGPLAGQTSALASVVLVGDGDDHRIEAFHNTLVASG